MEALPAQDDHKVTPSKVDDSRRGLRKAPDRSSRQVLKWARLVHVYLAMVSFFLILFFGLTGFRMNHPSWSLNDSSTVTTSLGVLATNPVSADGSIDYLMVSEFARNELGVSGPVESYQLVGNTIEMSFSKPGYEAKMLVDAVSGNYDLRVEQRGWATLMKDLHRGGSTEGSWRWVIDAAAIFLILVALSGIVMQLFLRRRRRSAVVTAAISTGVVVAVMFFTLV